MKNNFIKLPVLLDSTSLEEITAAEKYDINIDREYKIGYLYINKNHILSFWETDDELDIEMYEKISNRNEFSEFSLLVELISGERLTVFLTLKEFMDLL